MRIIPSLLIFSLLNFSSFLFANIYTEEHIAKVCSEDRTDCMVVYFKHNTRLNTFTQPLVYIPPHLHNKARYFESLSRDIGLNPYSSVIPRYVSQGEYRVQERKAEKEIILERKESWDHTRNSLFCGLGAFGCIFGTFLGPPSTAILGCMTAAITCVDAVKQWKYEHDLRQLDEGGESPPDSFNTPGNEPGAPTHQPTIGDPAIPEPSYGGINPPTGNVSIGCENNDCQKPNIP